jgi:hypothetical protein
LSYRTTAAARWFRTARGWLRNHAPELFGLALCCLFVVSVLVIAGSFRPEGNTKFGIAPLPRDQPEREGQHLVAYTNRVGGYAFRHPSTWDVTEAGGYAELVSPDGSAVLSFGGSHTTGEPGIVATLPGTLSRSVAEPVIVGTTWERIAGLRSFLVSGTAMDRGSRIRFLVISIPEGRPTHEISIIVPAGSAPTRMLARVERIVASFAILSNATPGEVDVVRG